MTIRTITPDQRAWAEIWIAGLRDGPHTSIGGFPFKAANRGILSDEEATALADLDALPTVLASTVADVVHDALFNGMTVMEAIAARGIGAQT